MSTTATVLSIYYAIVTKPISLSDFALPISTENLLPIQRFLICFHQET